MRLIVSCADSKHEHQRQPSETENHNRTTSMVIASTTETSGRMYHRNIGNSILSDDLRDQFESMKRISRQARRRGDNDDDRYCDTGHENSNINELKRKERQTAIETAIKVDNEINQWRDDIANLEALLLAEEQDGESSSSSTKDTQCEEDELRTNNNDVGITEIAFVVHHNNHNKNNKNC